MRTFEIPNGIVIFQSCPGGQFHTLPDSTNPNRIFVRYPSQVRRGFLAPIAHELAHVVQIRRAGSLMALDPVNNHRRIELGADFLAGLAFNISLPQLDGDDFETSLFLVGSYVPQINDHGTPDDRTIAFRMGRFRAPPYSDLPLLESLDYFYDNHLPTIRRQGSTR